MAEFLPFSDQNINLINFFQPSSSFWDSLFFYSEPLKKGIENSVTFEDKRKIAPLKLYLWEGARQYFKYFWYDLDEQKAYYFDFDV